MAKFFKWLIIIIVLLVVCIGVLLFTVDPNQFKPRIEKAVKDATGRTLNINGDISWQLFPSLGIALSDVELMNPQGFSDQPTAILGEAAVSAQVMPLLSGDIKAGDIRLEHVNLHIIKRADGTSNLDGLTSGEGQPDNTNANEQPANSNPSSSEKATQLSVSSIELADISVRIDDQAAGTTQSLALDSLSLSSFVPGETSQLAFSGKANIPDLDVKFSGESELWANKKLDQFKLTGLQVKVNAKGATLPNGEVNAALNTDLTAGLQPLTVAAKDLTLNVDDIEGRGQLQANLAKKPDIKGELNFDTLDLNPYLPEQESASEQDTAPASDKAQASSTPDHSQALDKTEPDLSALDAFNAHLTVTAKQIIYQQAEVGPLSLTASVNNGVARIEPLSLDLYEGQLKVTGKLDSRRQPAAYNGMVNLTDIHARPLLNDVAQLDMLGGRASTSLNFSGNGLSPYALVNDSAADGEVHIRDGAYYGVNVAQLIRNTWARLKGEKVDNEQPKKTDFTSLDLAFTKESTQLNNTELNLQSPLLRITGQGDYQLDSNVVDYHLGVSIVGSLAGQGGDSLDDLKGITIPLSITGTAPEQLNYRLDLQDAIKDQTKQKLKDKVDKEKDKLKDKLRDKLKEKLKIG